MTPQPSEPNVPFPLPPTRPLRKEMKSVGLMGRNVMRTTTCPGPAEGMGFVIILTVLKGSSFLYPSCTSALFDIFSVARLQLD